MPPDLLWKTIAILCFCDRRGDNMAETISTLHGAVVRRERRRQLRSAIIPGRITVSNKIKGKTTLFQRRDIATGLAPKQRKWNRLSRKSTAQNFGGKTQSEVVLRFKLRHRMGALAYGPLRFGATASAVLLG
ncbi:hypothetical protein BGW80DRAFT_1446668 [Lactifluus volemus]|nr:hypothetical protein BGW80DRAFT_1446668 [Lactifluus volemus]